MRRKNNTLTPQELGIMKLVWQRRAATVRDVYEALLRRRKIAYTTVMTMMKILENKGYLKKRRQDRAFIYRPAQPKNPIIGGMIREFIDRVFNGSAERPRHHRHSLRRPPSARRLEHRASPV